LRRRSDASLILQEAQLSGGRSETPNDLPSREGTFCHALPGINRQLVEQSIEKACRVSIVLENLIHQEFAKKILLPLQDFG
jgi:Asp-tRNA(Asn)/Glu-tRNA(Gln) amidotransferase B subunit